MGTVIRLTNRQWDDLDHLRNYTGSAEVFRNCSIILLSDGGHSLAGVAQLLGCSPATVKRIRRLYREGGLDALTPKRPPGRTRQATPTFRDVLAEAVQTNPQTLGYGFATWSAARLAAHLGRVTGITLSAAQVRRLLHEEGFSVHRPKHTMKGKRDEAAYQKAKAQLRRLKKKRWPRTPRKPWSSKMRSKSIATPPWRGCGPRWEPSPRFPRRERMRRKSSMGASTTRPARRPTRWPTPKAG